MRSIRSHDEVDDRQYLALMIVAGAIGVVIVAAVLYLMALATSPGG